MAALISILTLFIFLGLGFAAARLHSIRENPMTESLSAWVLYGLLFFMGFRIAVNTGSDRLLEIGVLSVVFAVSSVGGTVVILLLMYSAVERLFRRKILTSAVSAPDGLRTGDAEDTTGGGADDFSHFAALREPLKLLLIVVAGFTAGWFIHIPGFTGEAVSGWMLRFLLFSIGIDMVKSGVNLKAALAKPETIYLPLGVIIGSLLGSLIPAAIFEIEPGKSLAVASGFGWYSLSGVLITDMGDPILGSASFVSNILRETIALLSIPLISRSRFPHIGIGVAGATSMDVTLPLIEKSCGPDSVPVSITSGAILSLLVPVLVPLFFQI
ncbi:MAG: lysine exporter LysO family protein [Spirochaetales bacterium]|uniref:Lysine exporter LysO family protein n=1 Tax=Candidatus Thalassospirochaeta sargassi TaxID=3119039 RepID=A0AAJ1II16_9SPIO|nr:lysine exporter LysO family protein [Spirochaetales bacterium]